MNSSPVCNEPFPVHAIHQAGNSIMLALYIILLKIQSSSACAIIASFLQIYLSCHYVKIQNYSFMSCVSQQRQRDSNLAYIAVTCNRFPLFISWWQLDLIFCCSWSLLLNTDIEKARQTMELLTRSSYMYGVSLRLGFRL